MKVAIMYHNGTIRSKLGLLLSALDSIEICDIAEIKVAGGDDLYSMELKLSSIEYECPVSIKNSDTRPYFRIFEKRRKY
jgi:hypothetical protein